MFCDDCKNKRTICTSDFHKKSCLKCDGIFHTSSVGGANYCHECVRTYNICRKCGNNIESLQKLVKDKLRRDELVNKIRDEVNGVDIKPYSHNIISIHLREIAEMFGNEESNRIIDELNLEELGWSKEKNE